MHGSRRARGDRRAGSSGAGRTGGRARHDRGRRPRGGAGRRRAGSVGRRRGRAGPQDGLRRRDHGAGPQPGPGDPATDAARGAPGSGAGPDRAGLSGAHRCAHRGRQPAPGDRRSALRARPQVRDPPDLLADPPARRAHPGPADGGPGRGGAARRPAGRRHRGRLRHLPSGADRRGHDLLATGAGGCGRRGRAARAAGPVRDAAADEHRYPQGALAPAGGDRLRRGAAADDPLPPPTCPRTPPRTGCPADHTRISGR